MCIRDSSYAADIKVDGDSVIVKRQYEDRYHELKAKMPCLVTALSELNQPRYMTPGGIFDACDKEVTVWGRADLKDVDDSDPVSYTHLDVYKRQAYIPIPFLMQI